MSLLLDALKRAEEAKRAKQPADGNAAPVVEPVRSKAMTAVDRNGDPVELSLQDIAEVTPSRATIRQPSASARIREFTGADVTPSISPNALGLEPTPALAGVVEEARQRETARTVFAAKHPVSEAGGARRGRWLLPVIAVVLVIVGGGGWYVWSEINRISRPFAPVASRPPNTTAPATAAVPHAAPTTGQLVTDPAKTVPPPAIVADMPPLLPPPMKDVPLPKAAVGVASGVALTERQALAKALKEAPVAKEPSLALSRTSANEAPVVSPALLKAYEALKAGDSREAKTLYAQVLAGTPNNLDAHLGMATAAGRLGENALAVAHYRDALNIDPRNGPALAGLLALAGEGRGPGEVDLKMLVSRNPESASLHFSLGNLYSGEKRWVEAQQSYFEAFKLDSDVPEYVYNLAVALDHLRQSRLASEYYRRALASLGRSTALFDKASVVRRIQELSRDFPEGGKTAGENRAGDK